MKKLLIISSVLLFSISSFAQEIAEDSIRVGEMVVDSFPLIAKKPAEVSETKLDIGRVDTIVKSLNESDVGDDIRDPQISDSKNRSVVKSKKERRDVSDKSLNAFYSETDFSPFEKGNWHINLVLNVRSRQQSNRETILINIVERELNNFDIGISVGYFVRKNMSTGLNLKYSRSHSDMDYISDSDTANVKRLSEDYEFTPFLRNYIPLTKNERFSIFNETRVTIGYGQTVSRTIFTEDTQEKTYSESLLAKVGITPGMNAFIVEGFSFEVSVDLIGLSMDFDSAKRNGGEASMDQTIDFDFSIDLLSINFGLAYYF